jgi:hypothetical protein
MLGGGCSRMTADEEHDVRLSFGLPADIPMQDLGVVRLRLGTPKRVGAGQGKVCTLTATELTNGAVQLSLLYESKGEVIAGGQTPPHSERVQRTLPSQLVPRPGGPDRGWLCFSLTQQRLVLAIKLIIVP